MVILTAWRLVPLQVPSSHKANLVEVNPLFIITIENDTANTLKSPVSILLHKDWLSLLNINMLKGIVHSFQSSHLEGESHCKTQ